MSWSQLWGAGCFAAFAFLPITLPLAMMLGCPSYGHVIVLYFLAASLPSVMLAICEGIVDKAGMAAWGEWIGSYPQGLPPTTPAVRAFRPHCWGKWLAIGLAILGTLLTIAGVIMYPQAALQFILTDSEGAGLGHTIVALMTIVLGGPVAGAFVGYAYGIHLGAIADIVLRVAVRQNAPSQCNSVDEFES